MINFLRLRARNFASWQRLSVNLNDRGNVCFFGSTGAGKSSIWNALFWCLFGSTPEEVKAEEIRRLDNKPTIVTVVMEKNGHEYTVVRYRGHKYFGNKLEFKGYGLPVVDEDSYVKTVQDMIHNFLGASAKIFLSTTYFAQRNFRQFHSLTDLQKKNFLEDLTYGSLFELCEEYAKNRAKDLARNINFIEGEINGIEIGLKKVAQLNATKEKLIRLRIDRKRNSIHRLEENIERLDKERKNLEIYTDRERKIEHEISYFINKHCSITREINKISFQPAVCSSCGAKITRKLKMKILARKKKHLSSISKKLKILQNKKASISIFTLKLREILNEVSEKENKVYILGRDIRILEESLSDFKDFSTQEKLINGHKRKLAALKDAINYINFWVKGFGFQGLRTLTLVRAVNFLRNRIHIHLNYITGKRVKFDLFLKDQKLHTICNNRSYESLSGGEKQAVDISTGLGLRDLAEWYNKCKYNILILDEPVEGLDEELTTKTQDLLLAYGKSSTFLVTHQRIVGRFSAGYNISKEKNISKIERVF